MVLEYNDSLVDTVRRYVVVVVIDCTTPSLSQLIRACISLYYMFYIDIRLCSIYLLVLHSFSFSV